MRRLSNSSSAPGLRSLAKLAFLVAAASLSAQQEPQSADSLSREVKEVFQRAAQCVVRLHASDQHGELCGTGFFVDPTGTIYTSYSVGGEADDFAVEFKGRKYPARQLVADIRSGLAILKVDLTTPCLPIGKSEDLEVAAPIVTIGFPLDLAETPNFGMIAGFDHKYLGHYFSTTHLRVNATTQRGEMGAPLLNLKGEVVGVVVGSLENGSSCYAIPVEAAEKIQRDFVRFGEVRHGWIGANVREASARVQGSRAEITDLSATTPATDSGLRPGDILLQVGKVKVHEPEDVLDASFFLTAGDAVPITVVRGNETLTFTVQADFHPASKRPPLLAAPSLSNRAIPLNLQSVPQRTP